MGHPLVNGYQSHYCITTKGGLPFTKKDYQNMNTKYDELVIGQESQVVPLFLLEMNKKNIVKMAIEWSREVPDSTLRVNFQNFVYLIKYSRGGSKRKVRGIN